MNIDEPLAFFITWTCYGTYLKGDIRGWRRRLQGAQLPEPLLAQWRRERLKHKVRLLSAAQQVVVEQEIERHCDHRDWKLWAANARSNHVHVVVTAPDHAGNQVRDQLKANATRGLRDNWEEFVDRPVWTVGGDCQTINSEDALDIVCIYVRDAQDRMERGK